MTERATSEPDSPPSPEPPEDLSDPDVADDAADPDVGEEEGGEGSDASGDGDEGADAHEADDAEEDGPVEGDLSEREATAEGNDEATLVSELDHLQEEFDALNDRHLRLAAEFNNYRRRQETALTQAWGRAQAELVGHFLDVLDDLQRVSGLELSDEAVTAESIVEGVDLVERKFMRTLEDAGVEVVDPEEGEPFDPEKMEAMMRVPDESGEREDEVAQVFQRGYVLKDNLIRPARVSVYKG